MGTKNAAPLYLLNKNIDRGEYRVLVFLSFQLRCALRRILFKEYLLTTESRLPYNMANWKDVTGNKFEPTYIDVKYDLALFIDSRYYYELYYEQRLNKKYLNR